MTLHLAAINQCVFAAWRLCVLSLRLEQVCGLAVQEPEFQVEGTLIVVSALSILTS